MTIETIHNRAPFRVVAPVRGYMGGYEVRGRKGDLLAMMQHHPGMQGQAKADAESIATLLNAATAPADNNRLPPLRVRFFTYATDSDCPDGGLDSFEITESGFIELLTSNPGQRVEYERHTIHANGVAQVCLTLSHCDHESCDLELIE